MTGYYAHSIMLSCHKCNHRFPVLVGTSGFAMWNSLYLGPEINKSFWNREFKCTNCKELVKPTMVFIDEATNTEQQLKNVKPIDMEWIKKLNKDWSISTGKTEKLFILDDYAEIVNKKKKRKK